MRTMHHHTFPLPNGCIGWTGTTDARGYARIKVGNQQRYCHRVAWAEVNGPVPPKTYVLHTCGKLNCVNPEHMMLSTKRTNVKRIIARRRATLTEQQVLDIRAALANHVKQTVLAAQYGVVPCTIWNIKRRITWSHL